MTERASGKDLPVAAATTPRVPLVDAARGVAIVSMVAYHLAWDLSYLGLWPVDVSTEIGWIVFQRCILGSFLFLAGASLVLGHGERVRWNAFWRRTAILAAAALAMTLGTLLLFGEAFAFFGILHAILLFSLIGVVMLRLPTAVLLSAGGAIVAAGVVIQSDRFNVPWLAWLGFWTVPPRTADLVAVFPWLGVTLLGMAATRLAKRSGIMPAVASWHGTSAGARALRFLGRWSLPIYLVHQLALLAALYPLAMWRDSQVPDARAGFIQQCEPSCIETGGVGGYCRAYCSCALELIERDNLWAALEAPTPNAPQQTQIAGVINLCRAMAEQPAPIR